MTSVRISCKSQDQGDGKVKYNINFGRITSNRRQVWISAEVIGCPRTVYEVEEGCDRSQPWCPHAHGGSGAQETGNRLE